MHIAHQEMFQLVLWWLFSTCREMKCVTVWEAKWTCGLGSTKTFCCCTSLKGGGQLQWKVTSSNIYRVLTPLLKDEMKGMMHLMSPSKVLKWGNTTKVTALRRRDENPFELQRAALTQLSRNAPQSTYILPRCRLSGAMCILVKNRSAADGDAAI